MRMGAVRCDYLGPAVDCVAPRVAVRVLRRKRSRRRLRARVSERARLRIVVSRARRGRWVKVRTLRRRARKGLNRFSLGKLRAGRRHRITVTATDAAGNRSRNRVVRFRIRR
jgi:hypothetical protein